MFNITHTTPKRVLSHLLRLQREGEALATRDDVTLIEEGRWGWRVHRYLRRILADQFMLDRLQAYQIPPITSSQFSLPHPLPREDYVAMIRKRINTLLTTLTSVIDQLEAHIEASSC
jgi:hypothetical protein